MSRPSSGALSLAVAVSLSAGCTGGMTDLKAPVPEDLSNPTTLDYSGLTRHEIIDIAAVAVTDLGLRVIQADRARGYLETAFTDVANFSYLQQRASSYPARERLVQLQFSIEESGPETGAVDVVAYHRPFSSRDRPLPRDHPGYAVLNAIVMKMERGIRAAGGSVMRQREN